ncbi:MAG TPA: DMT family transporter [Azoarcus taiwanensis]|uniref:EamA family transporter n=1 Tax=Azoarcus taiwanensis TaxID=666964 RepID=A0A972FCK2_9RHOO|nr:EamA family transporter [Azoarcus taiwanensis]HRQ59326.1 DMT family transporter [Azoarcus taiwanensis]
MRHPLSHWLLLFALVAMWGSSFLLTKIAVGSLAPAQVVTGRLVLAALVLAVVAVVLGRGMPRGGRAWLHLGLMAVVGNVLPFMLITWGQQRVDSGLAGILMAVMPLATLVLAHFFVDGERLRRNRIIGFLIGFVGIVVLVGPQALVQLGGSGEILVAQLAILGGAFAYAVNTILARHRPAADVWITSAAVLGFAALLSMPMSVPLGVPADVPQGALMAVATLGLVSTAAATVGYFRLVTLAGPTFLSQINYLIPLWAVGMGMLFLGERPQWNAVAALLLILAGIAFAQRE